MELNKKQMTGIVTLSVFLSSLGVLVYDPSHTYYCEAEDSVKEFVRCSSTFKTCYDALNKGDKCESVWKPIKQFIEDNRKNPADKISVNANDKNWICHTDNGTVNSYTKCFSGKYEGYLGEFI